MPDPTFPHPDEDRHYLPHPDEDLRHRFSAWRPLSPSAAARWLEWMNAGLRRVDEGPEPAPPPEPEPGTWRDRPPLL